MIILRLTNIPAGLQLTNERHADASLYLVSGPASNNNGHVTIAMTTAGCHGMQLIRYKLDNTGLMKLAIGNGGWLLG